MTENEIRDRMEAARRMDWAQVLLNGGPPCFHLEVDGTFCGRARRWHDEETHGFVGLADLLAEVSGLTPEVRPIYAGVLNVMDVEGAVHNGGTWMEYEHSGGVPPDFSQVVVLRSPRYPLLTQFVAESAVSHEHARELAEEARRNDRGLPA